MTPFPRQSTCVAIAGRAILIEGPPGVGKSSLALALMDRGARLIGDDSILLACSEGTLVASPHPSTKGLLEVRNLGILPFPCLDQAPVAIVLELQPSAPRYVEGPGRSAIAGVYLPFLSLHPESLILPLKAELALAHYGLPFPERMTS